MVVVVFDVYFVNCGDVVEWFVFVLVWDLWVLGLWVELDVLGFVFGKQFKWVDCSGVFWVLVIGEDEVECGEVCLKVLNQQVEEFIVVFVFVFVIVERLLIF